MENRSHALLAGLFTLLLGVAIVGALWWFGGKHEDTDNYVVVTTSNVTGLNVQAQVRYRGIRVGKVEAIELDPENPAHTLIDISVRRGTPVTAGTVAKLGYQGVTGIAHVLLEQSGTDNAPLRSSNGQLPRITMQDSLIQELADVGSEAMRGTRDLLAHANQVLSDDNRAVLSRTLANLEQTTGNARDASEQLKQLLSPDNVRLLHSTLVQAEKAAGQAGPLVVDVRTLVGRLQTVSDKLDSALGDSAGGGVASVVPRINALSDELSSSSRQLGRVLHLLEEAPQSLIFGQPKPVPGPGEPGFSVPQRGERK